MSAIPGTNLAAPVVPFTTDDAYPTHDSLYGKGGHREVGTLAERDAIPAQRQRVGMLCYVVEDATTYQLTALGWVPFAGGGGSDIPGIAVVAAVDLGGHRVVTVDGLYADASDITTMNKGAGLTVVAVSAGQTTAAYNTGVITEPSWNWSVGQPVYLGLNGLLTQTPPTTGYLLRIGQPKSATSLIVEIAQPIQLT